MQIYLNKNKKYKSKILKLILKIKKQIENVVEVN